MTEAHELWHLVSRLVFLYYKQGLSRHDMNQKLHEVLSPDQKVAILELSLNDPFTFELVGHGLCE